MGKLLEIIKSGVAPGFPQKGRLDPNGVQSKALRGLKEIENEPVFKHGPARGARRIADYMGFGNATHIRKTWEKPFRPRPKRVLIAGAVALFAAFLLLGRVNTAEGQYITPGISLVNGQIVYASTLNQLVGNAKIGPGFISTQPIDNAPLASDYVIIYSPTLSGLYKVNLTYIFSNPQTYTALASGTPNINTNDLFQFYSQSANAVLSITATNFISWISSNLDTASLSFANSNNGTATYTFTLSQWTTAYPYQTNNQAEFLAWGTNGDPFQIAYSNIIGNAQSTIETNSIPWDFAQIFQPWTIYGTNTFFTNAFGYTNVFAITNINQKATWTNSLQTLTATDTIPIDASLQGSNTTATLAALYGYFTNLSTFPAYTIARTQFAGTPATSVITNMSPTTGIITNDPLAVNWSNATPVSILGGSFNGNTSPTMSSNIVYWAQITNNANLGFQLFTTLTNALTRYQPIVGNGVSPSATGTIYYITNSPYAVNCDVIQESSTASVKTGFYLVSFLTPSTTPIYYVTGIAQAFSGTDNPILVMDYLIPITTNSVSLSVIASSGTSGVQSPLVHVLIQPQ